MANTLISPPTSLDAFHGLRWSEGLFFRMKPEWSYDPNITSIEQTIQSLHPSDTVKVEFLAEGSFNKIYKVQLNEKTLIIRVALPLQPILKTKSEVATVDWVRQFTDIPLPEILAWDATRKGQIGFEWILMTEIPGRPLEEIWDRIPFAMKERLTRKIAGFCASLWRRKLRMIGNIYPLETKAGDSTSTWRLTTTGQSLLSRYPLSPPPSPGRKFLGLFASSLESQIKEVDNLNSSPTAAEALARPRRFANMKSTLSKLFSWLLPSFWKPKLGSIMNRVRPKRSSMISILLASRQDIVTTQPATQPLPLVGQIASLDFCLGPHAQQNVDRGPFLSSRSWMESRIALAENDCQGRIAELRANEEDSDSDSDIEDDICRVEKTQMLISKLESLIPLLFPRTSRAPEPTVITHGDLNIQNIMVDNNGELTGILDWEFVSALPLWMACSFPRFLIDRTRNSRPDINWYDDGKPEPDSAYFEDLHQYETTVLRKLFMDEMRTLEPEWVNVFNSSQLQRDFEAALHHVDVSLAREEINKWVDEILGGNWSPESLCEKLGC